MMKQTLLARVFGLLTIAILCCGVLVNAQSKQKFTIKKKGQPVAKQSQATSLDQNTGKLQMEKGTKMTPQSPRKLSDLPADQQAEKSATLANRSPRKQSANNTVTLKKKPANANARKVNKPKFDVAKFKAKEKAKVNQEDLRKNFQIKTKSK